MNSKVIIQYRTREEFCRCCDQKLQNAKTSEIREFEFDKQDLENYGNWKKFAEFEDDLQEIIRDYVYETIRFFATSSDVRLLIDNSEIEKVKKFVLEEVIAQSE